VAAWRRLRWNLQSSPLLVPVEVLGARWEEIDWVAATWNVPASRMKSRRPHRVPLSEAALAVLERSKGHPELAFPNVRGRPLANLAMRGLHRRRQQARQAKR